MMTEREVEDAAQRLLEAERDRRQIGLLSLDFPEATMDDAYRVQTALVKRKAASGLTIKGWKIGLTSPRARAALNADVKGAAADADYALESAVRKVAELVTT